MLKVGDYVTGKSVMGTPVTGKIVYAGAEGLVVDDGNRPYCCSPKDVAKIDPPIPNEDVMLDEFDEGGLKKMPDGTLESVHIPTEKEAVEEYPALPENPEFRDAMKKLQRWAAEEEMKLPYTATGTGGPPKPKPPVLEWKVEVRHRERPVVNIALLVDGEVFRSCDIARPDAGDLTARRERRLAKKIAEAKENILRLYRLTLKESGRVE